jgi:dTDP-4-amino-4,6-dideoxygalactose transaminase
MILLNDFKKQYAQIKEQIDSAVFRVLESGWYILGKELTSFETEFAEFIGVPYCVGVASGTEAIALSLMALGIGPGDEVIAPCFTAFPTITGIMQTGAVPVLVDVNPEDGLINVNSIKKKLSAKTRAIVPVHLYGQSCDMDPLFDIADSCGLRIIEDCAQSAGATYKGKQTGSFGVCSAFSFYPTKNLGAPGDAGAVVTHDKDIYDKLLSLRNYGQTVRYLHDSIGINSRMDEMHAAVLRAKLPYLTAWNERRRQIAGMYRKKMTDFELIRENAYGSPCYHLFVIKSPERDQLLAFLKNRGIQALIHYPVPINRQKAFRWQKDEVFSGTEQLASAVLSLPVYPELTDKEAENIITALHAFSK